MKPTESDGSTSGRARAAELLRAAGILLEEGSFPRAVEALHVEVDRALGHTSAGPATPSTEEVTSTVEQARARHARLALEAGVTDTLALRGRWLGWLQDTPTWVAWGVVSILAVGFGLQALSAASRKSQWEDRFPTGAWIARYYGNGALEGAPLSRVEAATNHEFRASPAPGIPKDRWSARWDTCVVVKDEVELSLTLASDDGSRLLLDETPRLEVGPRPGKKSGKLTLEPGLRLLTLELFDKGGKAFIRLDGFEPEESEAYALQRPQHDGDDVRCE